MIRNGTKKKEFEQITKLKHTIGQLSIVVRNKVN